MNTNPTANKMIPGATAYNLLHATHVIGYVRDILKAGETDNKAVELAKVELLGLCRQVIEEFGAGSADADFYYDAADWDFTSDNPALFNETLALEEDGVMELGTLFNGPDVYYTEVPTQYDDFGNEIAWEFMTFKTLAEATKAKNEGLQNDE